MKNYTFDRTRNSDGSTHNPTLKAKASGSGKETAKTCKQSGVELQLVDPRLKVAGPWERCRVCLETSPRNIAPWEEGESPRRRKDHKVKSNQHLSNHKAWLLCDKQKYWLQISSELRRNIQQRCFLQLIVQPTLQMVCCLVLIE